MTEEIIIDDIDVSECEHFCKFTTICRNENIGRVVRPRCKNIINCYYKQLKRAEQKLKGIKEIVVPIKENTCFGMHCGAIDWILQTIEGKGENNG